MSTTTLATASQRQVWGETVADLSETDDRVIVLDADLATSTKADVIAGRHPERFVQVGIAEQNMVGMALGLSTLGYRPWLSSFGVFLTHRVLDQVRMLVSQTKAPIRLAAAYSGLLNGASGKTHQDLIDIAVMRALPNMTVLAPADAIEAEAVIRWAADHDGPVFLRLARDAVAPVFADDYVFVPRLPRLLRDGADATVVSTGTQTSRVVAAVEALAADGVSARHIHLPMLKPLDEDALLEQLTGSTAIVTVEEHSVVGGLGSLVSELTAGRGLAVPVTRLGLADGWSESGPDAFLLDKYGLSTQRVEAGIRAALAH